MTALEKAVQELARDLDISWTPETTAVQLVDAIRHQLALTLMNDAERLRRRRQALTKEA